MCRWWWMPISVTTGSRRIRDFFMGARTVITWFLKKLSSDWFWLIIPFLTLLVWYTGALLSSVFGPYHPEWLPDYVNIVSVYNAPFYDPTGLSYSLIMLHFIWIMILIVTVFLGEECAKSYLPPMGKRSLFKTILACVLVFLICVFSAIRFSGKSFYFGSFFLWVWILFFACSCFCVVGGFLSVCCNACVANAYLWSECWPIGL